MKTLYSIIIEQNMRRANFVAAAQLGIFDKNTLSNYCKQVHAIEEQEVKDTYKYLKSFQKKIK